MAFVVRINGKCDGVNIGNIKIRATWEKCQIKLVVDAPKDVKIERNKINGKPN